MDEVVMVIVVEGVMERAARAQLMGLEMGVITSSSQRRLRIGLLPLGGCGHGVRHR